MTPQSTIQRHPILGAFYGLLLGLGIAIYLVLFEVTPFRFSTVIIVAVVTLVVGALWGSFAPARRPDRGSPTEVAISEARAESDLRERVHEQVTTEAGGETAEAAAGDSPDRPPEGPTGPPPESNA